MKIKLNYSLVFTLLLSFTCGNLIAVNLPLSDVENSALVYSPRIKSLANEQKAYSERSLEQKTQLYPSLFLNGSYEYLTSVPKISIPVPGFSSIKFGDNNNYSIGPLLSWTAWDFGGIKNTYKSASAAADAKKSEVETARIQVTLNVRSAYFQVALAKEQVSLYSDALQLANAQYKDIKVNVDAGTKSLSDELKSHQEVVSRMKELRQAQADLDMAIRELSALTGKSYTNIELENIDFMIAKFEPFSKSKLNVNHPALLVYQKSAESSEYSKREASSSGLPKLQLSAASALDYPNGTVIESYNQNTFAASLSWPLFESGAIRKRINQGEDTKQANLQLEEQLLADMKRDWDKTITQLANLQDQKELNDISVSETKKLSQIEYKSYKTGSSSYLEVEDANFKALEAKIQAAKTKVQILMNLAVLASLAE